MLASADIQLSYIDLYRQLRNYIWSFDIVEMIADLEVSVYQAIPDIPSVQNSLKKLKSELRDVMKDDEDLKNAFEQMGSLLDSADTAYVKLYKVGEVVTE